jgi:hypothetical protein
VSARKRAAVAALLGAFLFTFIHSPAAFAQNAAKAKWSPLAKKIKFKRTGGATAFSVKPQDNGAKLVDASEKELARYTVSGAKLKIKSADDDVIGYVVCRPGKLKIEDDSDRVLLELERTSSGDWRLESASEKMIYRIKPRSYGFEIETVKDTSLYKIKLKGGRTSLRNARDETTIYTNEKVSTLAVAPFGFDVIRSRAVKAGIAVALAIDLNGCTKK